MLPRRSSKLIPAATARRAPRGATLGLPRRGTAVAAVRGEADRIAPTSIAHRREANLGQGTSNPKRGEPMAKSSVTEIRTSQGFDFIRELGQQLRVDSIRSSTTAGSGHPTSSMSAADLMAVLITRYLLYDWNDPQLPNNDHLIYAKDQASPLLTAIFDINRLGQRGPTEYEWETDHYRDRVQAFGCRAIVIDGHDLEQVDQALEQAREATGKPTVVIARTVKGKGFSEIENKDGWHGKALPPDMAERAIAELGGVRHLRIDGLKPEPGEPAIKDAKAIITLPIYKKGDKVATRKAYGDALNALGARPTVVVMDGEVSNSTFADEFAKAYPQRYFEMFIAEQQLIAAAVGMSVRNYIPFASTFAAFLSRAYDFIRMAAISEANIRLCGSHAGVEIGEDGPSLMALEDLAAMRAVHGSTVLYPSDATSTAQLVKDMADQDGISYIRTTRGAYPVLYEDGAEFHIGGSKLVRSDPNDRVTLIGAGVTLHNCLAAADDLEREGIKSRVIDLYSVKPVDRKTLQEAAALTRGRMIVVEDHYPEGGLGAAVMEALAADMDPPRIVHLAVRHLPGSGKPAELMDKAEISARHIVAAAKRLYGL